MLSAAVGAVLGNVRTTVTFCPSIQSGGLPRLRRFHCSCPTFEVWLSVPTVRAALRPSTVSVVPSGRSPPSETVKIREWLDTAFVLMLVVLSCRIRVTV